MERPKGPPWVLRVTWIARGGSTLWSSDGRLGVSGADGIIGPWACGRQPESATRSWSSRLRSTADRLARDVVRLDSLNLAISSSGSGIPSSLCREAQRE